MPSIMGEGFSIEMAWRVALGVFVLVAVFGSLVGWVWWIVREQQRRRAIVRLARTVNGTIPSHDALRKWCQERYITAANTAQRKRGTAEGLFAGDDCRYWHTLIDILDASVVVDPRGRLKRAEDVGGKRI